MYANCVSLDVWSVSQVHAIIWNVGNLDSQEIRTCGMQPRTLGTVTFLVIEQADVLPTLFPLGGCWKHLPECLWLKRTDVFISRSFKVASCKRFETCIQNVGRLRVLGVSLGFKMDLYMWFLGITWNWYMWNAAKDTKQWN